MELPPVTGVLRVAAKRPLMGGPPGLSFGVRIPEVLALLTVERLRNPLLEWVGVLVWRPRDEPEGAGPGWTPPPPLMDLLSLVGETMRPEF